MKFIDKDFILIFATGKCYTLCSGTGWGRAHKRAVSNWYTNFQKNPEKLARLVTKFKNRESWCHKDVLRLAHTSTQDRAVGFILRYCCRFLVQIL